MDRTLLWPVALMAASCAAPGPEPVPHPVLQDASAPAPPEVSEGVRLGLLAQGAEALSQDAPARAVELLGRYLELEPQSAMAHFLLGVAWLDLGDHEAARASLVQATRLDPADAGGLAVLARVDYELGRFDDAVATLERVLELEPATARHHTSLGLIHFENGRWEQAYDAFLVAVELDPSDLSAHRGLARIYVAAGELDLAERSYRTAQRLAPDDPGLQVGLGHVLRDLDRAEEALEAYDAAVLLDPGNLWIEANLGSTLMELGRMTEARPHFERVLPQLSGVGRDVALIRLNYGMLLEALGDLDGAVEAMTEAVAAAPDLASSHEALGLLLLDRGERAAAREHLQVAFHAGSLPADALVELVLLHEEQADWTAALDCARALLEFEAEEDDGVLDFRRAQLRMHSQHPDIHDPDQAEALLRPLVDRGGSLAHHAGSWLLLSEVLEAKGSFEEALGALEEALADTSPDDPVHADVQARRAHIASLIAGR